MSNKILINFTTIEDGNLAYHVGDIKQNVDKNRQNLALKLGFKNEDLVYMNQVHGNNVLIVDKNSEKLIDDCDGIITNTKNLPLMVMVADCIPILFYDEKKRCNCSCSCRKKLNFFKNCRNYSKKNDREFCL